MLCDYGKGSSQAPIEKRAVQSCIVLSQTVWYDDNSIIPKVQSLYMSVMVSRYIIILEMDTLLTIICTLGYYVM